MTAPFRPPPIVPLTGPSLLRRGCVCCGRGDLGWCLSCRTRCASPPANAVPGAGVVPALVAYDEAGAELVSALKSRGGRRAVPVVAEALAGLLVDVGPGWTVTWAPTSGARRRRRGYDQSELLARAVARRVGLPCRRLLERAPGPAQTGRNRAARLTGVSYRARSGRVGVGAVVIDDVCTTGATLAAAAGALRMQGWSTIRPIAVARTP